MLLCVPPQLQVNGRSGYLSRLSPPFTNLDMARGSTIVLVALCLGLTVRADEYGEADGDATGASDAVGALPPTTSTH